MKVLIWIGVLFIMALLRTLLEVFGNIRLGAIPTVLLFAGCSSLAIWLCKLWDAHRGKGEPSRGEFT